MKKLLFVLALLTLTGCYQTVKSSYPYEYCLSHSAQISFRSVQNCAQNSITSWQRENPNLRFERDLYLDAYVNDLVDQIYKGQISDSRARLLFAQKVKEINNEAKIQKEAEEKRRLEEDRRRAEAYDNERIRMQQEYQRIKPVIDREWCSSWSSVGDDRCFWDRAGARRSGDNQNNIIIQQPQKNTGYPFPLSSSYNSGQNKICIYKNSFGESKALTLKIFETCPSMY
jgi:hypothetical protein